MENQKWRWRCSLSEKQQKYYRTTKHCTTEASPVPHAAVSSKIKVIALGGTLCMAAWVAEWSSFCSVLGRIIVSKCNLDKKRNGDNDVVHLQVHASVFTQECQQPQRHPEIQSCCSSRRKEKERQDREWPFFFFLLVQQDQNLVWTS